MDPGIAPACLSTVSGEQLTLLAFLLHQPFRCFAARDGEPAFNALEHASALAQPTIFNKVCEGTVAGEVSILPFGRLFQCCTKRCVLPGAPIPNEF